MCGGGKACASKISRRSKRMLYEMLAKKEKGTRRITWYNGETTDDFPDQFLYDFSLILNIKLN